MYDPLICLIKLTYHLLRFLLCHFLWASHSLSALRAYLEPFTLILSNHLPDAYPVHLSPCWASSLSLFLLPQGSWESASLKLQMLPGFRNVLSLWNQCQSWCLQLNQVPFSPSYLEQKDYFQPYFVLICFSLLYHDSTVKTLRLCIYC